MADIRRIRRPGWLRSRAARVAGMSLAEHGIGEALIGRWNGSAWSITG
jgi:hypothetical protein